MNKVLILGGGGFIGSALVNQLLENEANQVTIVDNFSRIPQNISKAPKEKSKILNLDLKKVIDKKLKLKLNDLFVENKVLVIRKQFLNPNEFQKAAEIFGKIFRQHNSKFSLKENPLVHYISNEDKFPDGKVYIPGEGFHTDHSNDKKPPKATILLSKEIPSYGGDTQFINMNLLYENLSNEMKNKIKNLKAKHVYQSKFSKRKLMSIKNQDHKNNEVFTL